MLLDHGTYLTINDGLRQLVCWSVEIVLLDHGTYLTIDDGLRQQVYCSVGLR